MKITCESCGAKYTIADDKVRGRKVKIRCKGCGTPIVVDGQSSAPANGEVASTEADAALSLEAPASVVPDAEWSVNLSDTEQLSLSAAQIVEGWQAGKITADAFVWKDGMGDWIPILESPELAPLLAGSQAGQPAAAPAAAAPAAEARVTRPSVTANGAAARTESKSVRPAARAIKPTGAAARTNATAARVTGRAQGAQDLFAGVERAGADEEEVQTSAPVLPQAGGKVQEEKATGARNENSVLFSLDALKAGFSGPSKPEPAKAATGGASDDPFGMGSAPAVASLGGGNALFTLAQNQALLTAPAPVEPPPQRVAPAAIAGGHAAAAAPASPKRTILLAVIGVGVLGVGLALGLGLSGGKDDKDKASAETATATTDDKAAKAKEEPKPAEEPKKEEPKPAEEAKKEEPAKDPTAAEPEKTEAKPEETTAKAPSPTPSPGGGTGKVVAKEPKEEPKPAPAASEPFSKNAAVSALSAAASSAASCKKIGGPTGGGKVKVTFAPSGRVTSANVDGPPFAGTSVGGCVASIFRRAKVPPFSGSQVTVSKGFTIH